MSDASKQCSSCGQHKPLDDFYRDANKGLGRRGQCKACIAATRVANKSRIKRTSRKCHLNKKYGITPQRVAVMFGMQEGLCAICAKLLVIGPNTHVDHCHSTGRVRAALLCFHCNSGIGFFKDDVSRLRAAAAYVDLHKAAV